MSTIRPSSGASSTAAALHAATPAQVQTWLQAGEVVLIDVREPDEHAREHIAGTTLMPLSQVNPANVAALASHGKRVVFHCKSGRRSADACRMAASTSGSLPSMTFLEGGIEAWKEAKLPVVVNSNVSKLSILRQVQIIVGLAVLAGSTLAYFVHPGFVGIAAFFGAGLVLAGSTGFCGLAAVLGMLPWNKVPPGPSASDSSRRAG